MFFPKRYSSEVPPVLRARATLTVEERAEKHRLLVRDTMALSSLLALVMALTFVTWGLFHSFAAHRLVLEQRWKQRGEAALRDGRPQAAIESLRSALAYAPDERSLQVELATALAGAGRTQEALVYFDTLHEQQPGDGMINLQLARLAVRQGNASVAITNYQAALDGTWNGDGVIRRREVRLELSQYLVAHKRFDEARNQLLIAAGNAADNHGLQLTVAGLLEQADGDADALGLYRKAMAFRDTRNAGLVGAGRTAAAQGHYLEARNLLNQATVQGDYGLLPEDERDAVHTLIEESTAILAIYPAQNLSPRVRAVRVGYAVRVARQRLNACSGSPANEPAEAASIQTRTRQAPAARTTATSRDPDPSPTPGLSGDPGPATDPGPLRSAITAVQRAGSTLAGRPPAGSTGQPAGTAATADNDSASRMQTIAARWQQLPPDALLARRMEQDQALLDGTMQLVYDTEKALSDKPGCPAATRDDLLLLKIAAAPDEVEQP